jgi:hypothetical protein
MKSAITRIIPTLHGQSIAHIDLDALMAASAASGIPMREPKDQQRVIDEHHRRARCITYGGWLEDRSRLWRGSYLDEGKRYIHLGVDINVAQGTPIHAPVASRVVDILHDPDTEIGWGTRVILSPEDKHAPYLLFAHLSPELSYQQGEVIPAGALIGSVGTWPRNGNVFEHMHVQAITRMYLDRAGALATLDGYGPVGMQSLRTTFPEPLAVIDRLARKG